MSIRIVVDSSANLQTLESENIISVPLTLRTNEREFVDNEALNIEEMAEYLSNYKGKTGSACPSSVDWVNAFGDAEEVIAIAITSNLSGSFNSARIGKEEYEEEYPGRKVFLVDSLSAGPELKLYVEKIRELEKENLSFELICEKLSEYQKNTHLIFMLKSLTNLANNGRVSPAVAKIADILNINIVGIASDEGTLEQKEKARGDKKAIAAIRKVMDHLGYAGGKVRIDHCFNIEDAQKLKDLILSVFPSADVVIDITQGLCTFYAERGGLMIGFEG